MKAKCILLALFLVLQSAAIDAQRPELKPASEKSMAKLQDEAPSPLQHRNGLWGFADAKGNWHIKAKFTQVTQFDESGHAFVCYSLPGDKQAWGILNMDGTYATEEEYDVIKMSTSQRHAVVRVGEDEMAVVDRNGKSVARGHYEECDVYDNYIFLFPFPRKSNKFRLMEKIKSIREVPGSALVIQSDMPYDNLVVKKGFKYGMIDVDTFEEVVPFEYELISLSSNRSYYSAKKGSLYGALKLNGESLAACVFQQELSDLTRLPRLIIGSDGAYMVSSLKCVTVKEYDDMLAEQMRDNPKEYMKTERLPEEYKKHCQEMLELIVGPYSKYSRDKGEIKFIRDDGRCDIYNEPGYNHLVSFYPLKCNDYSVYSSTPNGRAFVRRDGHYGLIDKTGEEVIPCMFDGYLALRGDYVAMRLSEKHILYGPSSQRISDVYYDAIYEDEGLFEICTNGNWGIMDKDGKVLIPPSYENIRVNEGFAIVRKGGKYGVVTLSNKVVVPCLYDDIASNDLSNYGLFQVKKNGKYGFVNKSGKEIVACTYDYARDFADGMAMVRKNGRYGFINKNGALVVPCIYEVAIDYSDGWGSAVDDNDQMLFFDKQGAVVRRWNFAVGSFHDGLAWAVQSRTYYRPLRSGVIDKDGNWIVTFDGEYAEDFEHGFCLVRSRNDAYHYYINRYGNRVTPDFDERPRDRSDGYTEVKLNGKFGLLNTSKQFVIPCEYTEIGDFENGMAVVKEDDKTGIVDKDGKVLLPCESEDVAEVYKNFAVHKQYHYGATTYDGRELLPFIFSAAFYLSGGTFLVRYRNDLGLIEVPLK